jgi:heme oxygenase
MLAAQLKERTREEHALLERKMLDRISSIAKASDYVDLLSLLYGYYAAVESQLTKYFQDPSRADLLRRQKACRILEDMTIFAPGHQRPALCVKLPEVNSFYNALGVLYVLEGSTLGGRIIARLISRKLGVDSGLNFFLSYGNDVDKMWASFKLILQEPFTPEQKAEVVAGALQTFRTFNYWLSEHE